MTELKTLKDIFPKMQSKGEIINFPLLYPPVQIEEILKAEAVKWMKAGNDEYRIPRNEIKAINNFIMEFFNLTEEDLK